MIKNCLLFLALMLLSGCSDFSHKVVTKRDLGPNHLEKMHLEGPLTYLGEGSQCIAFTTADEKHVIKFFKQKGNLRHRLLHSVIPVYHRKHARWEKKLKDSISRYITAYTYMKEETALVGIHFKKSDDLSPIMLIDKSGDQHTIDLNAASFVVQKRAKSFTSQWAESKDSLIEMMLSLLEKRAKLGFHDLTGGYIFDLNYGFVDNKAVLFDVGRIQFSEVIKDDPKREILKMKTRFYNRLKSAYNYEIEDERT